MATTLDSLTTAAEVAADPHVEAAEWLAADLLAPQAERVDLQGVPRSHVDALAAAGLLGLVGPTRYGGAAAPAAVVRAVTEHLSGADGSTWFVSVQHHSPLKQLALSDNEQLRERWLPGLCSGAALGGVAFSHLRRPGPPGVRARPVSGGWVIDGTAPWVTSWGLMHVVLLGAMTPRDDVLFVLVPARAQPGLRTSAPLPLAAMGGTHTVQVDIQGLFVPAADVVAVVPLPDWQAADRLTTVNVSAAVFGLLRTVVRRLAAAARERSDDGALELADRLEAEGARVRSAAYRLLDDVPAGEQVEDRLTLRAHALELTVRASTALVTIGAGGSMSRHAPAQRLAREALFHLVQAQTAAVRAATLRRLGEVTA